MPASLTSRTTAFRSSFERWRPGPPSAGPGPPAAGGPPPGGRPPPGGGPLPAGGGPSGARVWTASVRGWIAGVGGPSAGGPLVEPPRELAEDRGLLEVPPLGQTAVLGVAEAGRLDAALDGGLRGHRLVEADSARAAAEEHPIQKMSKARCASEAVRGLRRRGAGVDTTRAGRWRTRPARGAAPDRGRPPPAGSPATGGQPGAGFDRLDHHCRQPARAGKGAPRRGRRAMPFRTGRAAADRRPPGRSVDPRVAGTNPCWGSRGADGRVPRREPGASRSPLLLLKWFRPRAACAPGPRGSAPGRVRRGSRPARRRRR